jgi:hypothetical protein
VPAPEGGSTFCTYAGQNVERFPPRREISTFCTAGDHNVELRADSIPRLDVMAA